MAKAVADGHRVVLVTGTRGELGEIVVPDMDTPENHRRLGEIRAGELERAMGDARRHRVGEPRLSRLGDDGPPGQPRPAHLLAGRPRRGGRPAGLARPALPARRHDDLQRVRRLRPSRPHPDPRRRGPAPSSGPAIRPGIRSSWPRRRRPRRAWAPSKLYEQAIPASVRDGDEREAEGARPASFWEPPEDATPGADRRVRGVRREDARPGRGDHDLARHLGRPARPRSGRPSTST